MTPQRAKELLPVITAFANGETVECSATEWATREVLIDASFDYPEMEYRIKPKPVTRPWNKPEDVPKPAIYFSNPNLNEHEWMMVIRVDELGIRVGGREDMIPWEEIPNWKWSRDCRAWHRCTVTEEA